jgi:hypothetical protein
VQNTDTEASMRQAVTAASFLKPALVLVTVLLSAGAAATQEAALLFDGIDDIATIPDPTGWPSSTSSLTVEAWVRPDDVSGTSLRGIVEGYDFVMCQKHGDNSAVALSIAIGPTNDVVTPSGSLAVGRWDHFAGTYDGVTMRIYHNGNLVGEELQIVGGPVIIDGEVHVGFWPGAYGFPGTIDEVRIWNAVRTGAEIAATFGLPLTGSEPNLIGYWSLDDGAGQVVSDLCPLGNDGTLGATAAVEPEDPLWTSQTAPLAFFFDGFEDGWTGAWSATLP